jgi:adhesin transport system outer membrane protein
MSRRGWPAFRFGLLLPLAAGWLVAAAPPAADRAAAAYGPADDPADDQDAAIAPVPAPPGVPPALLRAAALATGDHPSVRSAEAEASAARADLRGARWQRFPSVTLETLAVTQGRRGIAGGGITANIVGEEPILTFGRIGGTIDRAEATVLERRRAVDETARQVALDVTDSYYALALAARRQAILDAGLAQHRALLHTIQNRVRQQVSPQADLDLAMSRTAQLEQDLESARAQRRASLARLVELVGTAALDLGNVPDYDKATMHPAEDGAIARALACDPGIARLRAEAQIARADARVARAGLFPQVLGQVSHNEITGTRAGLVLRAQPGAGLSAFAAAEAARRRIAAADFSVASAERALREALQLDFVTNQAARERVAANAQASLTAELVTESYKRQFITGRRTWLDVMDASREATNARLTMAEAEIGAMRSNAHIWLRTCGWQPRPLDSGLEPAK